MKTAESLACWAAQRCGRSRRTQQSAMPIIRFLYSASPTGFAPRMAAFRQGLNETGYVEGQNVAIEYRWAEGHYDRLPTLAAELIHHPVAVLAPSGITAARAAKAATENDSDRIQHRRRPGQVGLVASLNKPDRNLTGVATFGKELGGKAVRVAA